MALEAFLESTLDEILRAVAKRPSSALTRELRGRAITYQ
jgi:hypothetical protein